MFLPCTLGRTFVFELIHSFGWIKAAVAICAVELLVLEWLFWVDGPILSEAPTQQMEEMTSESLGTRQGFLWARLAGVPAQFLPRPKLRDGFAVELAAQELQSHGGRVARLQCESPTVSIKLWSRSFMVATCDEFAGRSEHLFVGGENVPAIRWKEVLCHQLDTAWCWVLAFKAISEPEALIQDSVQSPYARSDMNGHSTIFANLLPERGVQPRFWHHFSC